MPRRGSAGQTQRPRGHDGLPLCAHTRDHAPACPRGSFAGGAMPGDQGADSGSNLLSYSNLKASRLVPEPSDRNRGISFEQIIALIEAGKLLQVLEHSNQAKYPGRLLSFAQVMETVSSVIALVHDLIRRWSAGGGLVPPRSRTVSCWSRVRASPAVRRERRQPLPAHLQQAGRPCDTAHPWTMSALKLSARSTISRRSRSGRRSASSVSPRIARNTSQSFAVIPRPRWASFISRPA
jgi:hypothetical protein